MHFCKDCTYAVGLDNHHLRCTNKKKGEPLIDLVTGGVTYRYCNVIRSDGKDCEQFTEVRGFWTKLRKYWRER